MRDTVQIHVTADLPIRVRALTYANRAEVRFGKAFPWSCSWTPTPSPYCGGNWTR